MTYMAWLARENLHDSSTARNLLAQTYRSNLWPSVSPSLKPALDAAQRGERLVVSEETKKYVERLKTRM